MRQKQLLSPKHILRTHSNISLVVFLFTFDYNTSSLFSKLVKRVNAVMCVQITLQMLDNFQVVPAAVGVDLEGAHSLHAQ
jgi:hypothetical protein